MTNVEPIYAELGRRIARERNRRCMSQAQLAYSLVPQVTRAAISNMEGGRQRVMLHVALDIANALRIPAMRLFAGLQYRPSQE